MLDPSNLIIYLDISMFFVGVITFLFGVFILSARAASNDVKSLAAQTARLAQKGLAEEVSGLVGNATSLLDAMNQLIKTTRGIGMLLILTGLSLMALSTWFALQIFRA